MFFTQGTSSDYQGLSSDILTILEGSFKGRLLEYNPATGKTRTLIGELTSGNGVALAPDESYVLVADQYRYRIKRYWLKGASSGKEDIFADNLPGFVHNIYIDDKNTLWAAFNSPRADIIPHNNPWLKAQLAFATCKFTGARCSTR
nr:hypothetical protein [Dulcicalothrix desertica]